MLNPGMTPSTKKLIRIQTIILFLGTIYAWSKLLPQFATFSPNPFLTACLYGSLGFLVALFWSVFVYQQPTERSERYLRNFLLFCVLFAASVVTYEAFVYYHLFGLRTNAFICTPGVHPLETPCFTGMVFFITAFLASLVATRTLPGSSDRIPG